MKKTIWFDMDGTLADLYSVEGWLDMLHAYDTTPYAQAAVMLNMSRFARYLNKIQRAGYKIGIISWLSKETTEEYDKAVTQVKLDWLKLHLPSVQWDYINIVAYGTPKSTFMNTTRDLLFDDEEKNCREWKGWAFEPKDIFSALMEIVGV